MNALNHRNQTTAVETLQPGSTGLLCGDQSPPEQSLAVADAPQRFRLLKEDEVVGRGDFVADERRGFELFIGPTGFRADAYAKQIYRLEVAGAARRSRKPL